MTDEEIDKIKQGGDLLAVLAGDLSKLIAPDAVIATALTMIEMAHARVLVAAISACTMDGQPMDVEATLAIAAEHLGELVRFAAQRGQGAADA